MASHVIASVPVTPPISNAEIAALDYQHTFYLQPYTAAATTVTFTDADNYSNLIPGGFPLESGVDSTERVMLSGQKQRGKRDITFDNQTPRVEAFLGTPRFARLADHSADNEGAATTGGPLVFYRGYPDGRARVGIAYVERMNAEGDPTADQFGYDVEFSFVNVEWFDGRQPVTPTFTSKTPVSGPIGTVTTATGTGFSVVTAAQFRTTGTATVVATQSTFGAGRTATSLPFAVPAGLTAGTSYDVFLVHPNGAVAAGVFGVTA